MKVLLDTDIGSDVDDALCLAYLLAEPNCDLLAITTVTGESEVRARLASSICRHAGRSIPIARGAERPLIGEQQQPFAPHGEALPRWPHDTEGHPACAVDLMREQIRRHPGEIVLIAIGPLTNVALLCAVDPEAAGLLKGLAIMGGDFGPNDVTSEWNFHCDPHAAAMVYGAGIPWIRTVGLDVTTRVAMSRDEVERRLTAPALRPVLDHARIWFRSRPRLTFHDPLAAAMIFHPEVFSFRAGRISLDRTPAITGRATFHADDGGTHEVAVDVDRSAYLDRFLAVITAVDADGGPRG